MRRFRSGGFTSRRPARRFDQATNTLLVVLIICVCAAGGLAYWAWVDPATVARHASSVAKVLPRDPADLRGEYKAWTRHMERSAELGRPYPDRVVITETTFEWSGKSAERYEVLPDNRLQIGVAPLCAYWWKDGHLWICAAAHKGTELEQRFVLRLTPLK